jgi:hypothetical protein
MTRPHLVSIALHRRLGELGEYRQEPSARASCSIFRLSWLSDPRQLPGHLYSCMLACPYQHVAGQHDRDLVIAILALAVAANGMAGEGLAIKAEPDS